MLRSTSQHPTKWALAMRREMQTAIGQQLRVIFQLPEEIAPELKTLASCIDEEPAESRADIVGTC